MRRYSSSVIAGDVRLLRFSASSLRLTALGITVAMQEHVTQRPKVGALITQTGGSRKVRWRVEGGGKRGGVRVIYYHVVAQGQTRMILIYRKCTKDDLTPRETRFYVSRTRRGNDGQKAFERLVESMQQHEEIRRGEREPSREFSRTPKKVNPQNSRTMERKQFLFTPSARRRCLLPRGAIAPVMRPPALPLPRSGQSAVVIAITGAAGKHTAHRTHPEA